MRHKKLSLILVLFILVMVACSSDPEPAPAATSAPEATTVLIAVPTEVVDIDTNSSTTPVDEVSETAAEGDGPNLAIAAATLGIAEQELMDALGSSPHDFAAAAATLGISEEVLKDALDAAGRGASAAVPQDDSSNSAATSTAEQPTIAPTDTSASDTGTESTTLATSTAEQPTVAPTDTSASDTGTESTTFKLEAWADNWFAAYLDDDLIVEDSVLITTERSFNAETTTFEASYPLNLNFILKDFKENDTGLEYIGDNKQQMGDGGFIMQLTDTSTGNVVAVTNAGWACTVIHEAPLDKSCENESNPVAGTAPCDFTDLGEPDGWKTAVYDDTTWTATTVYSANDVGPKDGYDQIRWDSNAELIWGPDLETNNTLLCRITVPAP